MLSKVYKSQGYNLLAFSCTRQGIINFKGYCQGKRRIETSEDVKGTFSVPEPYAIAGSGGAAAAGGKDVGKKAPPPDPKKDAKKGAALA
jgi:hypothetical protein